MSPEGMRDHLPVSKARARSLGAGNLSGSR